MAEENLRASGVYVIRNTLNGKVYVGSAVNFAARWKLHRIELAAGCHHSRPLQNAWNKYGAEAFAWDVVEFVPPEYLIMREQVWIDQCRAVEQMFGYNICPFAGSALGLKRDEATREKHRQAHLGMRASLEARAAMSAAAKGRKASPEARANMSAAGKAGFRAFNRGKIMSEEQKAKIGAAHKGRKHSPEHIAKQAAAQRGRKIPPDQIARSVAARKASGGATRAAYKRWAGMTPKQRVEVARKISAAHKARHAARLTATQPTLPLAAE